MVERLADSLTIQTAISDQISEPSIYARRRVSLNIPKLLPKTGLPVRITGVKFLIVDSNMPEILLG